jgi:hypothetical protein
LKIDLGISSEREALRNVCSFLVDFFALSRREKRLANVTKHGRYVDAKIRGDQIVYLWLGAAKEIVQLSQCKKAR